MRSINLNDVQENNNKIQAGGYVALITKVNDVPIGSNPQKPNSGDYLRIEFDIAEGPMSGYYGDMFNSLGFWGGRLIRSYKPKALPMFKQFIGQVEKNNPGFHWNYDGENDEQTLVGKFIGVILSEEEYRGNDGSIKTRIQCDRTATVEDIHNGKFKVPEKKTLQPSVGAVDSIQVVDSTQTTMSQINDDLPI